MALTTTPAVANGQSAAPGVSSSSGTTVTAPPALSSGQSNIAGTTIAAGPAAGLATATAPAPTLSVSGATTILAPAATAQALSPLAADSAAMGGLVWLFQGTHVSVHVQIDLPTAASAAARPPTSDQRASRFRPAAATLSRSLRFRPARRLAACRPCDCRLGCADDSSRDRYHGLATRGSSQWSGSRSSCAHSAHRSRSGLRCRIGIATLLLPMPAAQASAQSAAPSITISRQDSSRRLPLRRPPRLQLRRSAALQAQRSSAPRHCESGEHGPRFARLALSPSAASATGSALAPSRCSSRARSSPGRRTAFASGGSPGFSTGVKLPPFDRPTLRGRMGSRSRVPVLTSVLAGRMGRA